MNRCQSNGSEWIHSLPVMYLSKTFTEEVEEGVRIAEEFTKANGHIPHRYIPPMDS